MKGRVRYEDLAVGTEIPPLAKIVTRDWRTVALDVLASGVVGVAGTAN